MVFLVTPAPTPLKSMRSNAIVSARTTKRHKSYYYYYYYYFLCQNNGLENLDGDSCVQYALTL